MERLEQLARDWVVTVHAETNETFRLLLEGRGRRFIYRGRDLATLVERAHAGEPDDLPVGQSRNLLDVTM